MNIQRAKNTKSEGTIEFFVYPEKNKFVGVCLTFDIVEEGNDPTAVMRSIKEAAFLHLEVVQKKNLSNDLLNRYAPGKYWKKYFSYLKQLSNEKVVTKWQAVLDNLVYGGRSRNHNDLIHA